MIPYPFQQTTIDRLATQEYGYIIADECGLGKTLTALWTHEKYFNNQHMLYITKKVAKTQVAEVAKELTEKQICILKKPRHSSYLIALQYPTIVIVHYELIRNKDILYALNQIQWGTIVLDEGHYIKNRKSHRSKAIRKLEHAKLKLVLSGTPTNQTYTVDGIKYPAPNELWALLNFINPEYFKSYYKFTQWYCQFQTVYISHGTIDKVSGIRELSTYQEILNSYFVRRTKEDVAASLPKKIQTKVVLPLEGRQGNEYKRMVADLKKDFVITLERTEKVVPNHLAKYQLLLRFLSNPLYFGYSYRTVKEKWLEMFLESAKRTIVVTNYIDTRDHLYREFGGLNLTSGNLDTITEDTNLVFSTIKLLAGAIDLPHFDYLVFYEQSRNNIDMIQVEDRIHRLSSVTTKHIYYLVVEGTIDELNIKAMKYSWNEAKFIEEFVKHIL